MFIIRYGKFCKVPSSYNILRKLFLRGKILYQLIRYIKKKKKRKQQKSTKTKNIVKFGIINIS